MKSKWGWQTLRYVLQVIIKWRWPIFWYGLLVYGCFGIYFGDPLGHGYRHEFFWVCGYLSLFIFISKFTSVLIHEIGHLFEAVRLQKRLKHSKAVGISLGNLSLNLGFNWAGRLRIVCAPNAAVTMDPPADNENLQVRLCLVSGGYKANIIASLILMVTLIYQVKGHIRLSENVIAIEFSRMTIFLVMVLIFNICCALVNYSSDKKYSDAYWRRVIQDQIRSTQNQ